MIPVQRLSELDGPALDRLLVRGRLGDPEVVDAVAALVAEVRTEGDAALRAQTARFDGVELDALEVPRPAWDGALAAVDATVVEALEQAADAIRRFHAAQLPEPLEREVAPGLVLGRRPDPLQRVGVYAPGGRAAYPSSVLMGVVPARVAGVDEVVVCSPPGKGGRPPDLVMAACAVAGADRLFALGGAGAVAAMAYGTDSVPRVDRIVGPGNAYVTEAKRQVTTAVAIDSPAGPSEILILADGTADPETVAIELIAQAEHDPDAGVVLVTWAAPVAEATAEALARLVPQTPRREIVEAALETAGGLLVADDAADAVAFAERYAPEHMLILTADPRATLRDVRAAGTVFLGPRSSNAYGDYATGANHVLPTGGLARSYSGLSIDDFFRWTTWQEVRSDEAARALADIAVPLAEAEGLPGHAAAARYAAGSTPGGGDGSGDEARDGSDGSGRAGGTVSPAPRRPYRAMQHYDPKRPELALDLSANTNLWGPCPAALDALDAYDSATDYPTVYGSRLKAAVAAAWSVDGSRVVTGCGSDDVLDSAIRAFCDPGAVVAFPAPTFPMADVFARMNGARPGPVRMAPDGTLEDGALDVLAAADVVYLCRPNNPTGAMIDRDVVLELLDRARGIVLIDEAYGEFAGAGQAGPEPGSGRSGGGPVGSSLPAGVSLLEPALASGRGVVTRTLSKAYGLAGLRVGYAIGPTSIIRAIELSRGPYKVSGPAEAAAAAAVTHGRDWVRGIVDGTVAGRQRLAGALRTRGFGVVEGEANFVLAATGPGNAVTIKAGLADRGIGVRAFEGLDGVGDAIRVTVGPPESMDRFLNALDDVLAAGVRLSVPDDLEVWP
ncbi:MAG: histidinol dehydrogenase [Candidatus Longimicrobiales bacterium M2_2A_002]